MHLFVPPVNKLMKPSSNSQILTSSAELKNGKQLTSEKQTLRCGNSISICMLDQFSTVTMQHPTNERKRLQLNRTSTKDVNTGNGDFN